MEEKTLNNLQKLETIFEHACQVCDPLTYEVRQRNLLYTLANFLLIPLVEYKEEERKKAQKTADITTNPPVIDEVKNAVESV